MSLDVYLSGKKFKAKCVCNNCWKEHTTLSSSAYYDANITHNLAQMADEAGIYEALWRPEEKGWKKAKQLIMPLTKGLLKLKAKPEYFMKFNPSNGWGSYETLVRFVENYLVACNQNPSANISVSR